MNVTQFKEMLEKTGYTEIMSSTKDPQPENAAHAHEFAVHGLVTAGEFIVSCDGTPRTYRAGDQFQVAAGQMHTEAVGPEGACITAGRKY